jgi:multiple sugar transport system substrate-binding protein
MEIHEKVSQRRTLTRIIILLIVLGLMVFGISSCNFPSLGDFWPVNSPTDIPLENAPSPTPLPTATPDIPLVQPRTLVLWVPPQFDPDDGSTPGNLFRSRLDEFVARRPQADLQVRIKPLSGEFSLMDSLQLTDSAAPILMPDLIALPRSLMEQALADGLIVPLDDYTESLNEDDWFDYAADLARVADQVTGIPFAGDMMVLAYKNDSGEAPPLDWNAVINSGKAMSFPASDPRALVTLNLYQSLDGDVRDESGKPVLVRAPMLDVLSYYQAAQAANVMPYWLTQFETDQQAWDSYQTRQSTLAITWTSLILVSESPNTSLAAVPTKDGTGYSYADGWVWCVVPSDPETEAYAVELAEFLTDSSYLSAWTLESGYLPVRPSDLEAWTDTSYYQTLSQLLPFSKLIPDLEVQDALGPEIRDAVVSVLKDQVEPADALDVLMAGFPE